MPTYRLSQSSWLTYEAARARSVLLVHMEPERAYTVEELLRMLEDYGLHYSNPEYVEIGQVLLGEGLIEAVP